MSRQNPLPALAIPVIAGAVGKIADAGKLPPEAYARAPQPEREKRRNPERRVVVRKVDDEWQAIVYDGNRRNEALTYYASDKADAEETAAVMRSDFASGKDTLDNAGARVVGGHTYRELDAFIGNRTSRAVGNNTRAARRNAQAIAIQLHKTDIVTFFANGDVRFDTGGYRTVTTKARMNSYARPLGASIYADRGQWWFATSAGRQPFVDGISISTGGGVRGPVPAAKAATPRAARPDLVTVPGVRAVTGASGRYRGRQMEMFNPRRKVPVVSGIRDTTLDVWEERDRLHIALRFNDGSEFKDGPIIAEWWDDDARQMFEDGFFDNRKLHHSVYEYAVQNGLVDEKARKSNPISRHALSGMVTTTVWMRGGYEAQEEMERLLKKYGGKRRRLGGDEWEVTIPRRGSVRFMREWNGYINQRFDDVRLADYAIFHPETDVDRAIGALVTELRRSDVSGTWPPRWFNALPRVQKAEHLIVLGLANKADPKVQAALDSLLALYDPGVPRKNPSVSLSAAVHAKIGKLARDIGDGKITMRDALNLAQTYAKGAPLSSLRDLLSSYMTWPHEPVKRQNPRGGETWQDERDAIRRREHFTAAQWKKIDGYARRTGQDSIDVAWDIHDGKPSVRGVLEARENPSLMLVTGNPGQNRGAIERAWCEFHQRREFTGTVRSLGDIRGVPSMLFALGRLHAIDFGRGDCTMSGSGVWVCANASGKLFLVSERHPMDLSKLSGTTIHSVTYDPMRSSGKDPAYYKHEFRSPKPSLAPIGNAKQCRGAAFDGGRYEVRDWIYS